MLKNVRHITPVACVLLASEVALERLRVQRLAALTRAKAQPGSAGSRVFPRVSHGPARPSGQITAGESPKAIARYDVVTFHSAYSQPGRALIVVTGDVPVADVRTTVERALAARPRGEEKRAFSYPTSAQRGIGTIYICDISAID